MPDRWGSARDRSRHPTMCKRPSMPTPASSSTTEVTSEPNDTRQLYPMAKATKDTLGVSKCDGGGRCRLPEAGTAAAACEADGITACVPTNRSIHSHGDGKLFGRSAFVYKPEADTYICPARSCSRPQAGGDASRSYDPLCGARLRRLLTQASMYHPHSVALSVAISMRMRSNE